MRWALNYAMDRDEIVAIAYEGSTFKSEHFFPAYPPLNRYVDLAKDAGVYDVNELWAHNPDRAKELIESKGYTMGDDSYYAKDGKQLTLDIATHEAFIEKQRIAQVLVEQFQAIGINASNRNEAGATWEENFAFGRFEARMGWQTCGSVNEPWNSLDTMNVQWNLPVGERASRNQWRWSGPAAEEYSAIVDQIGTLPLGDPQIDRTVRASDGDLVRRAAGDPSDAEPRRSSRSTILIGQAGDGRRNFIHPPTWWQGNTEVIIIHLQPAQ
jgi:peptide/nickel transport system substrate-binding protein